MTAEELRVIQALQAHTGGLTVTEQDTQSAQRRFQETLDLTSPRRTRRPFLLAVAAVLVLIAGVVGFTTLGGEDKTATPVEQPEDTDADFLQGDLPTAELLQGIWWVNPGEEATRFMRFQPPNRYSMAGAEGLLFDDPAVEGTYVIEGNRIVVSVDPGSNMCAGLHFALRASVPEPNVAHLVSDEVGTDGCADPDGTYTTLQQLLPTHADIASWSPPAKGDEDFPKAGWQTPERRAALFGDWLIGGGGYLLEINPDGVYHVADDSGSSVDSGQWTWGDGELTFTSDASSTECSAGDRLVQRVEHLDITFEDLRGSRFMRTTVQQDSCGVPWAGVTSLLFN